MKILLVGATGVSETLQQLGVDPKNGLPTATVAQAYVRAVEGSMTGQVIEPSKSS